MLGRRSSRGSPSQAQATHPLRDELTAHLLCRASVVRDGSDLPTDVEHFTPRGLRRRLFLQSLLVLLPRVGHHVIGHAITVHLPPLRVTSDVWGSVPFVADGESTLDTLRHLLPVRILG